MARPPGSRTVFVVGWPEKQINPSAPLSERRIAMGLRVERQARTELAQSWHAAAEHEGLEICELTIPSSVLDRHDRPAGQRDGAPA